MLRNLRVALGVMVAAGLGLATSSADAGYTGTTVRTFCPAGATPRSVDRAYWDTGNCHSVITDAGNQSAYHYAKLPIPVDRVSSSATLTLTVYGYAPLTQTTCAQGLVYSNTESLVSSTSSQCNGSWGAGVQVLSGNVTVSSSDYTVLSLAGQHNTHTSGVKAQWEANGT